MYFKDFPQFLYDFDYGGVNKTSVVVDVTRNIRVKKELLGNVALYDEYDIVDGETPEIISEKFYGTPEYHWIIMIANEKYDYRLDFPLPEPILQKHIKHAYNPTMSSTDWYWDTHEDGRKFIHLRVNSGAGVPFNASYLTAPVNITLYDKTKQFIKHINFPTDELGLDETTQYFYFPYNMDWDITQFGTGTENAGVGNVTIYIDTEGREFNPVYFVNSNGIRVAAGTAGATPVDGNTVHRIENDKKRRIKIISPSLIETILRNYEDELR
jgi:hypothetical protein